MADEDAGHQVPFIARIPRLFVSVSHYFDIILAELSCRLYFPGVLVGPFLEYAAYLSLINGTSFAGDGSEPRGQGLPNGRKRAAYRKMLLALGFLGVYMGIAPKISFQTPVTDWFLQQNLLYRLVRIIIPWGFDYSEFRAGFS